MLEIEEGIVYTYTRQWLLWHPLERDLNFNSTPF
jgi:hypothetical protein